MSRILAADTKKHDENDQNEGPDYERDCNHARVGAWVIMLEHVVLQPVAV